MGVPETREHHQAGRHQGEILALGADKQAHREESLRNLSGVPKARTEGIPGRAS